jgi:hypothetical protein
MAILNTGTKTFLLMAMLAFAAADVYENDVEDIHTSLRVHDVPVGQEEHFRESAASLLMASKPLSTSGKCFMALAIACFAMGFWQWLVSVIAGQVKDFHKVKAGQKPTVLQHLASPDNTKKAEEQMQNVPFYCTLMLFIMFRGASSNVAVNQYVKYGFICLTGGLGLQILDSMTITIRMCQVNFSMVFGKLAVYTGLVGVVYGLIYNRNMAVPMSEAAKALIILASAVVLFDLLLVIARKKVEWDEEAAEAEALKKIENADADFEAPVTEETGLVGKVPGGAAAAAIAGNFLNTNKLNLVLRAGGDIPTLSIVIFFLNFRLIKNGGEWPQIGKAAVYLSAGGIVLTMIAIMLNPSESPGPFRERKKADKLKGIEEEDLDEYNEARNAYFEAEEKRIADAGNACGKFMAFIQYVAKLATMTGFVLIAYFAFTVAPIVSPAVLCALLLLCSKIGLKGIMDISEECVSAKNRAQYQKMFNQMGAALSGADIMALFFLYIHFRLQFIIKTGPALPDFGVYCIFAATGAIGFDVLMALVGQMGRSCASSDDVEDADEDPAWIVMLQALSKIAVNVGMAGVVYLAFTL